MLDSYRIKEAPKTEEQRKAPSISELRSIIDSLPKEDIDQEWIKDNEMSENMLGKYNQSSDEEKVDDILATLQIDKKRKFDELRSVNNQQRSQIRNNQINDLLNKMSELSQYGGKTR